MRKWLFVFLSFLMVFFLEVPVTQAASKLDCDVELAYDSTGSQVKLLQTELNRVSGCDLEVDGIFGPKTNQCVVEFQQKNNLVVDGIVGTKTCKKLNSLYTKELKKKYVVVVADELNVRAGTSTNSSVKATVQQGEVLQVYGTKKVNGVTWYKVWSPYTLVDDHYGYVHGDYVKSNALVLDINKQRLTYYRSGKVYMNVPVITGMKGSHDTPVGRYTLQAKYKVAGTTLTGNNDDGSVYHAYVQYWMPFITSRGIGFHDASWRSEDEFTEETYLYDGSHGCVNMRSSDAKKLYRSLKKEIDVVVVE